MKKAAKLCNLVSVSFNFTRTCSINRNYVAIHAGAARTATLTVQHALTQHVHVMLCDSVREGEDLSNQLGHAHLVHTQVGIRRNDCAATEVDTLP